MFQEIWPDVWLAIRPYVGVFLDSPPPIPQEAAVIAYITRNKEILKNILDLVSFMFITPELARRFLPSRKMLFQNYAMILIIGLPIFSLHRAIAWFSDNAYGYAAFYAVM